MQLPELVIFDCDGVLVDTERVSNQVMADLLAEHGISLSFEDCVARFIGRSNSQCLLIAEALIGQPLPDDFLDVCEARTLALLGQELRPVPGIEALIAELRSPFCVASNGQREKMRFTLGKTGLLKYFYGKIFCVEDVALPKPAPDLFLHAARSCGAEPARCVVIEDTPTGVRAARAAGMRAFGFAGLTPAASLLQAGAEAVFFSMDELPGLLYGEGSRAGTPGAH